MWQDRAKTLAEIAKFSRRDAERYPAYEEHLERLARGRGVAAAHDAARVSAASRWRLRRLPEARRAAARACAPRRSSAWCKIFTQSAADFLDEWFESPEVKVTLATDGVIGANGGPRSPGTAYILLHHCMGGVGGQRGLWGFVRGGMGAVSEAMAASARAQGRGDPHERRRRASAGARTAAQRASCSRAARRFDARDRGQQPRSEASPSCKLVERTRSAGRLRRRNSTLSHRRHVAARSIWR